MNNHYQLFKDEAIQLESPDFEYKESNEGVPELYGQLKLADSEREIIDSYQIRIVCSKDYPKRFPAVYELGGRLPINVDWHVQHDGSICICSAPEEKIKCEEGITLKSFIEEQIKPFFFNQKHRELYGYYLKERSHGRAGNLEFFFEAFDTEDVLKIATWLLFIKNNSEPNRVKLCFCGSEKKYRNCHRKVYRMFKQLSPELLNSFYYYVLKFTPGNYAVKCIA